MPTKTNKDTALVNAIQELLDFLEDNTVSDIHEIRWVTDEDCYIEGERSPEFIEVLQKVKDELGE